MSDPVTNVEIEDVLSSIRRLVSAEAKPAKDSADRSSEREAPTGQDSASQPKRAEPKLVLTPAQRVNDTPQSVTHHGAEPDSDEMAEAMQDVQDMLQNDVADFRDQVGASERRDGATQDDVTEDAVEDLAEDLSEDMADPDEAAEDLSADDHTETDDAEEDVPDEFVAGDDQDDDTFEASDELEPLEDDPVDDDEEDAAFTEAEAADADETAENLPAEEAQAVEVLTLETMADTDVPEFLRRPITQMNPPEDADVLSDTDDSFFAGTTADVSEIKDTPETFSAKLETLEAAVLGQAEDWEPDEGDQESLSAAEVEPLPWHDIEAETADMPEPEEAAEGQVQDDQAAMSAATQNEIAEAELEAPSENDDLLADAAQATSDTETDDSWFADDALLDEDALRDMVGEIVRQELQGALGERITRNVRKLVRREIHRALVSKGIE